MFRQMTVRCGAFAIRSVLLTGLAFSGCDQQTLSPGARVIDGEPVCSTCQIERFRVASIADDNVPGGALGGYAEAHVDTDGSIFIFAGTVRDELYYASRDGVIRSRVGRAGDGPGEYRWPMYVIETDRGYSVFDVRLQRLTILAKGTLAVMGTVPVPVRPLGPPLALPDGTYAVNAVLPDPLFGQQPIHIISPSGGIQSSFGRTAGNEPHPSGRFDQRHLALARDGNLWVAHLAHYRIEKWDLSGNLLSIIERKAPWFPLPDTAAILANSIAPGTPTLKAIYEDDHGRLWTSISRIRKPAGTPPGFNWDKSDSDAVVEVIDVSGGELIASNRIPGIIGTPTSGRFHHSTFRLAKDQTPRLEIWGYSLRQ